jgi:biopolymer transport protein ExbD
MKPVTKAYLIGTLLIVGSGAQTPALKEGVSVDMPVASHAVEMRAADEQNAVVVSITANGAVFVGIDASDPAALNRLTERTVYVKADVRAPFQTVLAVLDALHGKSVVLLSAPPKAARKPGYVPAYGTKVTVSQ